MKWIIFMMICPPGNLDFCEPIWDSKLYDTRAQCEQALEPTRKHRTGRDMVVMNAFCQKMEDEKTASDGEEPK